MASPDMRTALAGLVSALGVTPAGERDRAEDAAQGVLEQRGLAATVAGIRWGVLELHCDAPTARLLRFDHDVVLAAVQAVAPDVSELRVRVVARTA